MLGKKSLQLVADGSLDLAAKQGGGERERARDFDEPFLNDKLPANVQSACQKAEIELIFVPLTADMADVSRIVALDALQELLDANPCRLLSQSVRDRHAIARHAIRFQR